LHESRAALLAHFLGDWSRQLVGGRALDRRVREAADAVELRFPRKSRRRAKSSSVSPGNPAMNVERIVMSGQISRQALMRASVFSAFAGRFMSFRMRGLACWNGTSRYGRILPCAISGTTSSTCGYG
jgi:hypothetical protein